MTRKSFKIKVLLFITLIILSIASIYIGIEDFSMIRMIRGSEADLDVFINSRLPRFLSVLITGVSLSIAGLIMQTISANKLVSPSTAGTMDWAKLGILFAFFFVPGSTPMVRIIFAFIVAIFGSFVFMTILKKVKFQNVVVVPLLGLMLGNVVSAVSTFIAFRFDLVQNINSWLIGDFSMLTRGSYELLYLGLPFMILAYIYASKFTIASMGEEISTGLGLNYKLIITVGLIIVSVITANVIVTVGTIPFVGLIVPNIISMYRGDNVKKILGETAILGACLLLFTDILSRLIVYPYQLSINLVMSVVGGIFFLFIIFRKNSKVT